MQSPETGPSCCSSLDVSTSVAEEGGEADCLPCLCGVAEPLHLDQRKDQRPMPIHESFHSSVQRQDDGSYDLLIYAEDQHAGYGSNVSRHYLAGDGPDQPCEDARRLLDAWRVGGLISLEADARDVRILDLF